MTMAKHICLLSALAVMALLAAGCSGPQQVYLRPIGSHVEYWFTYYPRLRLNFPPTGAAAAAVTVAARGTLTEREGQPDFFIDVRVEVHNTTPRDILILKDQQLLSGLDAQPIRPRHFVFEADELEGARIAPGETALLRMRFDPEYLPEIDERVRFVYRLRYAMYAQAWPENVEFARILPGDVRLPTVWNGVLILRF